VTSIDELSLSHSFTLFIAFQKPSKHYDGYLLQDPFYFKTFDLRSVTSDDQLQHYHSINLNFLNEKTVSAPQIEVLGLMIFV
jgi:hypothetical protein